MELVKIRSITPNPDNPRLIKNEKYKLLLHSVKVSPAFMLMNPIKVDLDNMILGGNMRYKACMELKKKEVPIEVFTREHAEINNKARREEGIKEASYEEQCREFIIKDNISFGEHDWDILANDWDALQLQEYGLKGFPFEEVELDGFEGEEEEENETHKTISIAFPLSNYEEANTLINYWKEQGMCVGTILHKLLKTYSPK